MSRTLIEIIVPGEPVPKARARVYRGRTGTRAVTPSSTKVYQGTIAWQARGRYKGEPVKGVHVAVNLFFVRTPGKRGDIDNLAKAVLDALKGVIYRDDDQVVMLEAEQTWSRAVGAPYTWLQVVAAPRRKRMVS